MASILRRSSLLGAPAIYSHLDDTSQHELQTNANRHTRAPTAYESPANQSSENATLLGKPSRKRMFHIMDIAMAFVALACLALSILVVSNRHVSWYLGVGNRQLIVIGFLLSIMNLCLASVTPTLFLLLEARVGNSTLQNYDGILRNKPLASKLSFAWRMVLVTMLALPVGLSVAYKTFTGGESSMKIHTTDYITNATYFGLFRPPAMSSSMNGVSFFFNATASFRDATERAANGSEPPLPTTFPQAYGYNLLLLDKSSAASLDILHANYILAIQELLAPGESWNLTAPVLGTVATFDESATEEDFKSACTEVKQNNTWYHESKDLYVGSTACSLSLTDRKDESDQSLQYVGLAPGNPDCTQYAPHNIYAYNIYRKQCWGKWSVNRGGFRLLDGSCDHDNILPSAKQQVIQWQYAALPQWYIGVLIEMLRTFCLPPDKDGFRGNQSHWMMPYMSVSVATMLWSSTVSKQATQSFDSETFNESSEGWHWSNKTIIPHKEADILYPVNKDKQTIIYNRPTLRKSPWLYLVLGIQPILLLIFLGMIALLHTVPLDKGFGLISILSGIERPGLDSLSGASLSGELKRPVKLSMSPVQGDGKSFIEYRLDSLSKETKRNGRLARNVEYN
ncbi:hypothetical protein CGCSCA4_v003587 [Colletotrichum siamense]|uniref:Uncharacterized protein n=1 Tax=Colletotrichum siamense TaxID=690259 RepID=A0A9P5EZ66_COLSI|nr:hypothetical protein CGCSCA4_v003587 [Colletotrichum siamense]KAF4862837.1 hypothetical protein CGCSCA2_v003193 [Colletotrichum siamense]